MGRYLYDTDDLNNPVRLMETASLILADLSGSLATIGSCSTACRIWARARRRSWTTAP